LILKIRTLNFFGSHNTTEDVWVKVFSAIKKSECLEELGL